jgi:hypothetical protein
MLKRVAWSERLLDGATSAGSCHQVDLDPRRIEVESWDKMRKRGLRSPDRADAMAMTPVVVPVAVLAGYGEVEYESITGDLPDRKW